MLVAKVAIPQARPTGLRLPIVDQAVKSRLTLFTSPAGYFCSCYLATTLAEQARPVVWLRLGPEDADPATLLLSLIGAARRLQSGIGAVTLGRMQQQPGPLAGWERLFVGLGQELAEGLPAATALVLEHVHHIAEAASTLALLKAYFLPALPPGMTCILATHTQLPAAGWPDYLLRGGVAELRVNARSAASLAACAPGVSASAFDRAVTLTEGRADVVSGLCAVAEEAGAPLMERAIARAANLDDLLSRTAQAWLATARADDLPSLALALPLDYSHPALIQAALGQGGIPAGPVYQPLGDGWMRVHCAWKPSLQVALRQRVNLGYVNLRRLADYLAEHDGLEAAVRVYTEIGDLPGAARALAKAAGGMMALGQWQTLHHWLEFLARQAAQKQPGLDKSPPVSLWRRLLSALGWHRPDFAESIAEAFSELTERNQPRLPTEQESPATVVAMAGASDASLPDVTQTVDVPPVAATLPDRQTLTVGLPKPLVEAASPTLPSAPTPAPEPAVELLPIVPEPEPGVEPVPQITAHLLGAFSISINGQPIENWPSGRGQAVFKYLLMHHDRPVMRDVLMDVFWPEASPEVVRNRLHVALYSLRQKLRTITDTPIILFEDGAYRLAAAFHLWLDVDEFSRHVEKGGRLEAGGQMAKAAADYELALNLYQGDLLVDDPYEGWPVLAREPLRLAYLDMLDRLSRIYFDREDYAACEGLCHLILMRDSSREDAHRQLMRCYSRQGQPHLALRQYQICLEALRTELDVEPAPATRQLAERIRHHERV